MNGAPPGARLPLGRALREAAGRGALVALCFALVYGAADRLTALHGWRVRVDFPFERSIPFIPAWVLAYLSIYPLFLIAPAALRAPGALAALARDLLRVIGFAGIGFLLVPATLAFPAPVVPPPWTRLFAFADAVNLTYNLFPSLHVALSAACALHYAAARPRLRALWCAWAALIAASTLLLHQHQLLDVAGGALLAGVVVRRGARREGDE